MHRSPTNENQSLTRGLWILAQFAQGEPELGVRELGRLLRLDKSVVARLVRSLANQGFLEQNPISKKYRVGPRAFEIGQRYVRSSHLHQAAYEELRQVAERLGINAYVGVRSGFSTLYLIVVQAAKESVIRVNPGFKGHLHSTAVGKVLLASMEDKELTILLKKLSLPALTPQTITSTKELLREVKLIRNQGYAVSDEENFAGILSVAAPLRDLTGRVVASLSTSTFKGGHAKVSDKHLVSLTKQLAELVSSRLGALPGPAFGAVSTLRGQSAHAGEAP